MSDKEQQGVAIALEHHSQLICRLKNLPEVEGLILQRLPQQQYLSEEQKFWQAIATQIDYLQKRQLGYCPPNPLKDIWHPALQHRVEVYSNYLFSLLQVTINCFCSIKNFAKKQDQVFDFQNPREVFTEMCRELSFIQMRRTTQESSGSTLNQLRNTQKTMGRFYRGTLGKEEAEKICQEFENSRVLAGFVIAAVYREVDIKYLKQNDWWKEFMRTQKELNRFLNQKQGEGKPRAIIWHQGFPVWADNNTPVQFP